MMASPRKHFKSKVRRARYIYAKAQQRYIGGTGRGKSSYGSLTKGGFQSTIARKKEAEGLKAVRAMRRRQSTNPIHRRGYTSVMPNIGKDTPPGVKGVSYFKFGGVSKISRLEPQSRQSKRAAIQKAWATRRRLYGKSGTGKKGGKKKGGKR